MKKDELTLPLLELLSKVLGLGGVIAIIAGAAIASGRNGDWGYGLVFLGILCVLSFPFARGFSYVVRAAVRYLELHGEPKSCEADANK